MLGFARKARAVVFSSLALGLFHSRAHANFARLTLEQLVHDSDVIVLGTVSQKSARLVMKAIDDKSVMVTDVDVVACYKMTPGSIYQAKDFFKFLYVAGTVEDVRETVNGTYVIFMTQTAVGPILTNGPASLVPIRSREVDARKIVGLSDREDLTVFKDMLIRLSNRDGCN
jgi:hypothetical protein